MNRFFHSELEEIRGQLILMGEKAVNVGRMATKGFLESDLPLLEEALTLDDEIDELEVAIARASVRYVALRAPVSSDVRLIFVAIKASHDFERVADEAHSVAKKARSLLRRDGCVHQPVHIERMSEVALQMMRDAINCLLDEDLDLAQSISERDKEVDTLNQENFKLLSQQGPDGGFETASKVETIMISKSIERIADHAKNLSEEVIFLLTGK